MKLKITVQGVAYEVDVEVLEEDAPHASKPQALPQSVPQALPPSAVEQKTQPVSAGASVVPSPLSGLLVSLDVAVGQKVAVNEPVAVIEAMKMRTTVVSTASGQVARLLVASGEAVREGQPLFELA